MDAGEGRRHDDPPWVPVPGMSPAEQAEMFGSIAMSSPTGVVASDEHAAIIWVNPVAEAMFGWSRDELLGRPFTVLLPPEEREHILEVRSRILSGELTTPFLSKGLRKNGVVFDVSATPGVRRDQEGRPLGTNMALRDVTEELRTQRELAEALARSRARFDQSARPQALLDIEGRFVEVNDAGCELLGWRREEVIGRDATEIIHPSDPELVRDRLDRLRRGDLRAASYETAGLRRDGTRVPLQIDITAVRDQDGRAYEFAAYARDLTELQEARRRLVSQEAFFRGLNRESSDATLVADADGHVKYLTPPTAQILGYEPSDLLNVLGQKMAHPDDIARTTDQRQRVRTVPGARERFALRLRQPTGDWRWFDVTVTNCLEDPDLGGLVVNLRDISAEVEAQQALAGSEARYRAILQTAEEGIIAVSLDGEILFVNERLTEILDLSLEQVYALGREGVFTTGERGAAARRLVARGPAEEPERFDLDYDHPRGGKRVLAISANTLCGDDGTLLGTLAMVSDVTEQRSAEARLRHQALHDALTGLPNRFLLADRLSTAHARQERTGGRGVAVLFLDLDDFKRVNDAHGHELGDKVLAEVAHRLAASVRASDTVARLGGDEFAVICEDADAVSAGQVASRIQKGLEAPLEVDGETFVVRASVGIALSPPQPVAELLRLADRAMYQAKLSPDKSIHVSDELG
ncbi:MAG TPA: PAS domain S-box protein [Nocardioidaceae bacterium]|nr:PAS domain S-box protein [Nocardioidaceae bacterium]